MADLVPAGVRATYYGKRFAMAGAVMMVCVLAGTGFLDWMIGRDQLRWGYTILFGAGVLSAFSRHTCCPASTSRLRRPLRPTGPSPAMSAAPGPIPN